MMASCWYFGVAPSKWPVFRSCEVVPPLEAAMQTIAPTDSAHHVIRRAGPAEQQEHQAGEEQCRDRHARNRVRGGADFSRQAGGNGHEQKAKQHDQHRAERIHVQRLRERDGGEQHDDADAHKLHREIAIGAGRPRSQPNHHSRAVAPKSFNPARRPCQIVGSDCIRS